MNKQLNRNNRSQQLRRDTDNNKNIKFDLKLIDSSIVNYIKNVIKPIIIENNNSVNVPIIYATPEKWKNIQQSGVYRDSKSNQLMVPIIAINKTSINKNDQIPVQDFENNIFKTIKTGWNSSNKYDSFSIKNNLLKPKEIYSVVVPRYIKLTYNVILWTSYVSQMNMLLEKFIFFENRYWGDNIYKFRTAYDNISNSTEVTSGKNRMIKSNFDMTVSGYILPEEYKNQLTTKKYISPTKIVVNNETEIKIR